MAALRIRIDYESMKQIAKAFARESEAAGRTLQNLQRAMDVLQRGDWIGQGAKAFYREMEQDVLPAMRRLNQALGSANRVSLQIVQLMQGAEDEASAILRAILAGLMGVGGVLSAIGGA
ncbi:MAG TPA: WXG100 family type VII secretion target, partial [Anaerolineales bacterium]